MKLELVIRPQARRDLREIWRYTEKTWSPQQADAYLAKLNAAMLALCARPDRGRPCAEVGEGLFRAPAERHVIFFRTAEKSILVVRVLHARMDQAIHLANDET